ncbi:MAG TPA: hypothetical protein GX510_01165 [Firmicutes bacterium]|nr:hypothetical protein [Candidatus Fermentithermobacillaceae bacterium]
MRSETQSVPEDVVLIEKAAEIAVVSINRPHVLNALNREVLLKLKKVLEELESSPDVRAVIITGAGDKSFVAGADIAGMVQMTPDDAREFSRLGHETFGFIDAMSKPVIAAVNGYALGGGLELALACDIRVAAENARLGQPEVGLGIIPGFGGTQRLSRLVGPGRAKDLIFTGRTVTAGEALSMGLVEYVVPQGEALSFARKVALQILEKSPSAVTRAKSAINRGLDIHLEQGLRLEEEEFSLCFSHPDQKEGMQAFLEKRKPRY